MAREVIWTVPAISDLQEAIAFLQAKVPEIATRLASQVEEHMAILKQFPFLGSVYEQDQSGKTREILILPYRIFYQFREKRDEIVILRVWHASRDEPPL